MTSPTAVRSNTETTYNLAVNRREIAARILLCSGLGAWFGFIGLFERYSYTRPTVKSPAVGRTYQQNNHGHYTYLTAEEHFRLNALQVVAAVLFLTGSLVDPERRMWRWRRNSSVG